MTMADWGPMVKSKLEVPGQIEVILIKYGFFDVFRFRLPWTRKKPIERWEAWARPVGSAVGQLRDGIRARWCRRPPATKNALFFAAAKAILSRQRAVKPPSMTKDCPVVQAAASEAR